MTEILVNNEKSMKKVGVSGVEERELLIRNLFIGPKDKVRLPLSEKPLYFVNNAQKYLIQYLIIHCSHSDKSKPRLTLA